MGGGKPIRFWQRWQNESRTYSFTRISTLSAFWLQVFLSGAILGLGFFFLAFFEGYLYSIGFRFGYDHLLNPLTRLVPFFLVFYGGIGFVFVYSWFKMAERPSENTGYLIFSALLYFGVIIFFFSPIFTFPFLILTGPSFHAVFINGRLFMDIVLVWYHSLFMILMSIPPFIVLVAGILDYTRKFVLGESASKNKS